MIHQPCNIYCQIFGGAGFALIQSGSAAYVNRRAPKELGTTAQALISGVLYEFSESCPFSNWVVLYWGY